MKPTVVVEAHLHPDAEELLSSECRIVVSGRGAEGEAIARSERAVGAIIGSTWYFTGPVFDDIPTLLVVGRPGIGVDNIDRDAANERGVAIVNTPDAPTTCTAEHAVALMMAAGKRLKAAARLLSTGGSHRNERLLIEFKGKTLGLVGLGRIGRRVAHICGVGLGMKVIAYDPYLSPDFAAELGVDLYPDLFDLLRVADVVSLHCPPTDESRCMINAEAFTAMKPSALLINAARGPVVDEPALIAALQGGEIAGAGLDVWDPEPPSPDNPLIAMEDVVGTPHSAGFTEEAGRAMGMGVVEEVMDVVSGRRPANLVNPEVWESPKRRRRDQA
jgi:D-3-phosphoglycerate dehydrogenase